MAKHRGTGAERAQIAACGVWEALQQIASRLQTPLQCLFLFDFPCLFLVRMV